MSLAAGGLYSGLNGFLWLSVILLALSATLAALHFSRSRNLIVVRSPSTRIEINAEGMKFTHVLDCIRHIEQARLSRIEQVKAKSMVV